jgi:hypothetical protein
MQHVTSPGACQWKLTSVKYKELGFALIFLIKENFISYNKAKIKLSLLLINHHFISNNGTLQVDLHAFLKLAARWRRLVRTRPAHFIHRSRARVIFCRRMCGTQRKYWMQCWKKNCCACQQLNAGHLARSLNSLLEEIIYILNKLRSNLFVTLRNKMLCRYKLMFRTMWQLTVKN